jgi:phosphoglycolate phosphatase
MRLLLFDIDGTLLRVNGGARTALRNAAEHVTGQSVSTDGVAFSGRTDPAIFRDVLATNGLSTTDALLSEVMHAYVEIAPKTIQPENVTPLAGAAELLSLLSSRTDVSLGLVTGNLEAIAFHKLKVAGLNDHFPVGGFGSDNANRSKLPPLALHRATEHFGHSFSPENTVVIGDTGHDIDCARSAGTMAAAVCTGRPSRANLISHNPDLVFGSFENPSTVADRLVAL